MANVRPTFFGVRKYEFYFPDKIANFTEFGPMNEFYLSQNE